MTEATQKGLRLMVSYAPERKSDTVIETVKSNVTVVVVDQDKQVRADICIEIDDGRVLLYVTDNMVERADKVTAKPIELLTLMPVEDRQLLVRRV